MNKSGCKVLKHPNKKDRREGRVKAQPNGMVQTFQFLKKENFKKKNLKIEKKKIKNEDFVSCVLVYDVIRFGLRYFLGFLAGFYLLAL